MQTFRVLLLTLVLTSAAPSGFVPYLVKDINPEAEPGSSNPQSFAVLGALALFQVNDFGRTELWRSDGTASGTYRLAETGYTEVLANTGELCFFRFQGADNRWHLRVTDGTLPGTFSLAETSGYSQPSHAAWVAPQGLLYFASEIPGQGHGVELWRSDGTPGGTYEVADLAPGPVSSNPTFLTSFQGRLYFAAGSALWQSDGTAQGTVVVREVPAVSLYVVGSRLVFFGTDAAHGFEPWASDGTAAGTRRIADLAKGTGSPIFHAFEVVGKRLFFTATASAARGQELYVTDGTVQGTLKLTSFSDPYALDQLPQATLGNRLLFSARNRTNGTELWSSDGTAKGTRLLLDACPGECPSYPIPLLQHRGRLYYQAQDPEHGFELWVTDGTAKGTRMVKDVCPGPCSSWPAALPSPGDRLFFTSRDEERRVTSLWTTDGTEEGTAPLAELGDIFVQGTAAGGGLVFSGSDPDHGRELWSSDGTPEGTGLLADVADEDVGGSDPHGLMTLGETALFFARDGHGTAARTARIAELRKIEQLTVHGGRLWFLGNAAELWSTDGTAAGTCRLDLRPPVYELRAIVSDGLRLYLNDFEHALWVSDGTAAGTRKISDQGAAGTAIAFAGRLYYISPSGDFFTSDGTGEGTRPVRPDGAPTFGIPLRFGNRLVLVNHGGELWQSDGTEQGTTLIRDLSPAYYYTSEVVKAGPRLFFPAWEDETGWEIWAMRE